MIPDFLTPLANHLWQSTLFAGVAGLLTLALRKNSARVRHWVWVAASVKFLAPFSVLIALGSNLPWHTVSMPAHAGFPATLNQVGQPFAIPAFSSSLLATGAPLGSPLPVILGMVWAIGFIGIACSWWIRWRRITGAVRAGSPVELGLPIKAISSRSFLEPGIFGVFRPVLLLPEGIFEHLSPEQWKSVVAHELCHVRHRDNLVGIAQMLVETVFWFHPLVWWVGKQVFQERERACDEEVLRLGSEPQTYARSILKVCEVYLESPLECVAGVSGSNLRKRIEGIMRNQVIHSLSLTRKAVLAIAGTTVLVAPIVIGFLNLPVIRAQSVPAGTPKWEAVSIKPCGSVIGGERGGGPSRFSPGRAVWDCQVVQGLVNAAYLLSPRGMGASFDTPITGGPSWIRSDRYYIEAKAEGTPSTKEMQGPMLQAILEDRFKLRIHWETREVPVYALVVAKSGPRLRPFKEGSCTPVDTIQSPPPPLEPGEKRCSMLTTVEGSDWTMDADAATVEAFSKSIGIGLGRRVIDKTGIPGRFEFHLVWANENAQGEPSVAPSIFTVVEELGLKLEATKGPGETLVIDHAERASEN